MSSISNIFGSTNAPYVSPTTNATRSVGGGDASGDNDGGSGAGKVGKSNFLNAVEQALGQTLSGGSGTSPATPASNPTSSANSTQDPQAALQAFMHSLFAALHQAGGQGNAAATGKGADADGDNDSSSSTSEVGRHHHGGSNLAAGIQNLLQQLSSNSALTTGQSSGTAQGSGTDTLGNLNSSFQNLIDALGASQGQGTQTASLQSFLQNLQQDLSGGQNISGAVVNTKA